MYSAAIYNYFNNGRQARNPKCRTKKIPIPKPNKKKHVNKCKLCGRKFVKVQKKRETDAEIDKQPGNIVFDKVLLIWKYAKNLLSNTVHGNDPQKCSFKIIAHKPYKKRSLHHEIVPTTSMLSQLCKICEKRRIQMNKCKELNTEDLKINEDVTNEQKCNAKINDNKKIRKPRKQRLTQNKNNKLNNKKSVAKKLPISNKSKKNNEQNQWDDCAQEEELNVKLCPKSSMSSVKIKKQKCNCICNLAKTTNKKVASRKNIVKKTQKPRKPFLPKKKVNSNKKKRVLLRENRKKVNRFASWQYMQHALSSVGEETITSHDNEDITPVYLTFEEYCLILEAIDTPGSTAGKFKDITGELGKNIEEIDTRRLYVSTEDVATNTDQQIENTEDASTNTEQFCESIEEVTTNTGTLSETTEESNAIIEQTNEITDELNGTTDGLDINTEQISETTEILAAINDPLSEASEEFDVNTDQPSNIHFETIYEEPCTDIENLDMNNELLNKSSETLDQNSSKDFNLIHEPNEIREQIHDIDEYSFEFNNTTEETIKENNNVVDNNENADTNLLPEGIEQTESSEDTLDNTLNQQKEAGGN